MTDLIDGLDEAESHIEKAFTALADGNEDEAREWLQSGLGGIESVRHRLGRIAVDLEAMADNIDDPGDDR